MRVIFISNFFDHHAKPLSEALMRLTDGGYVFLGTSKMTEERIKLGWGNIDQPSYVNSVDIHDEVDVKKWQDIILDADIVISGAAPLVLLKKRKKARKLTFEYSERVFKEGLSWHKVLLIIIKTYMLGRMPHNNHYLLAASAYSPYDFALVRRFRNKAYRWGYFPEFKEYDTDSLFMIKKEYRQKTNKDVIILWAGRLIDWKHPEKAVLVAKRLKEERVSFHMDIIGCGELEDTVKRLIMDNGVHDCVSMLGSMNPQEVRHHMEHSDIFLYTSDRNEGWGAVLNESMNSCCGVIACNEIGSVPYLMREGKTGFIYQNDDFEDLYTKVKILINNEDLRRSYGLNAYNSIKNQWNAEVAAVHLLGLAESLKKGEETPYKEGPCSKAPILKL